MVQAPAVSGARSLCGRTLCFCTVRSEADDAARSYHLHYYANPKILVRWLLFDTIAIS